MQRLIRFLEHPRLPLYAALLGVLLGSPSLFIGFHLDDHIHRYMLSDLPGGAALRNAYESPFGIANGDEAVNHWQIEQGIAPYWIYPRLHVSLWRPISELTHELDAALWWDNAIAMHLHNMVWFFLLAYGIGRLYRRVLGPGMLAGLAALLFAFDHNHGFALGWIANRNALVAAAFGAASLWAYVSAAPETGPPPRSPFGLRMLSALLLGAGLLSGEGSVAAFAYVLGYAFFVERDRLPARLLHVAPHLLVVIAWRLAYSALGRGSVGSGMYLDLTATPMRFLETLPERLPLLVMGQLWLPPPELAAVLPEPVPSIMWGVSLVALALALLSLGPLLKHNRQARFWAFGAAAALLIACGTYPHSRLLLYASFGMIPLLCQLWHGLLEHSAELPNTPGFRRVATALVAPAMGVHLFASPLLSPLTACSVVFASEPIETGLAQLSSLSSAETELIVLSAPEYFYVKLLPVVQTLNGRPGPRRLRALGFGPVETRVERLDDHTLSLTYVGGILRDNFTPLYRDPKLPMHVGERIQLSDTRIDVTQVTSDGRVEQVHVRFDRPLDDPHLRFVYWGETGFVAIDPPSTSPRVLPPAVLALGI